MREAQYYEKLENKIVRCRLCHQACVINKGQAGLCRARKNIGGYLYSFVYGQPAAVNVDPIEKKPLFHFLPGTHSYSLGTLGCNFVCANCQNFDLSQRPEIDASTKSEVPPEHIVAEALANGCRSISYTYNEPTIFAEYALEIMKLARQSDLKNVWVSNGYMGDECLKDIIPFLDAANIDLKSMDDAFYRSNCGARLEPVLKNIREIKKAGVHLEITTLLIPTLSDDAAMLEKLALYIAEIGADTPWHISKFSAAASWRLDKISSTLDETIYSAFEIGKRTGLKYIYAGNMAGDAKGNTYCPACGELAIERFGYNITRFDRHGRCAKCDQYLDILD